MTFDGSEKLIGTGAQAKVYLYKGFAYKVYNQTYPAEWISFEKEQQKAVNKAGILHYLRKYNVHVNFGLYCPALNEVNQLLPVLAS